VVSGECEGGDWRSRTMCPLASRRAEEAGRRRRTVSGPRRHSDSARSHRRRMAHDGYCRQMDLGLEKACRTASSEPCPYGLPGVCHRVLSWACPGCMRPPQRPPADGPRRSDSPTEKAHSRSGDGGACKAGGGRSDAARIGMNQALAR